MKKYLFSLICAAVVSTAWAQNPAATPVPAETAPTILPVSTSAAAAVLAGSAASAASAVTGRHGHCDACPATKTVCVSQPAKEIKTKVLYSSTCETLCHKGICQGKKKCGDCAEGQCGQEGKCGHTYVKRYLVKKICTQECDTFKCVAVQVPVCTAPCTPKCATDKCCTATVVVPGQSAPAMPPAHVSAPASSEASAAPPALAQPKADAPEVFAPLP